MAEKLENKLNINPPSGPFPYGETRDKTPSLAGTRWDHATMRDYIQFFHKLMDASGSTYNNLPESATNGFQFYEALRRITGNQTELRINLSQAGTATAPVPTYQEGSGYMPFGAINWTRSGAGIYKGTAAVPGSFAGFRQFFLSGGGSMNIHIRASFNEDEFQLYTYSFDDSIPGWVSADVGFVDLSVLLSVK